MKEQVYKLSVAVEKIQAKDINPYLQLRNWLEDDGKRNEFKSMFKKYYGLNVGGLTDEWKDRYFEILFSVNVSVLADPYSEVLNDLYQYPRRQGDQSLQFSFVSKLVAIHDEARPLYDRHVSSFFGVRPPDGGSNEFRIQGFVSNLKTIQRTYSEWLWEQEFVDVLNDFRKKFPEIGTCHPCRLFDFLVWAVGHYKLS